MRKQSSSETDWQQIWARVERGAYDFRRLDRLIDSTVAQVRACVRGRAGFGWSGGKDSVALEWVLRRAGITQCVMAMTNLEYPAFLRWVTEHMPDDLKVINRGFDIEWLARNQRMLFPKNSSVAAKWFRIVQHKAQFEFYRERRLDVLILGRRKQDGNHVGDTDGLPLYKNRHGIWRYSPMAEWEHDDVLALLFREELPLPPIYSWPRGYQVGTGPWAARQWTGSVRNGWREVHQIDPSVVREAATLIPSARRFLCVDCSVS